MANHTSPRQNKADSLPPPTPLTRDEEDTRMEQFREGLKASCQESLNRSRKALSWSGRFFDRENTLGAFLFLVVWLAGAAFRLPLTQGHTLHERLQNPEFLLFLLVLGLFLTLFQIALNSPWRTARPVPKRKEFLLVSLSLLLEFAAIFAIVRSPSLPTDHSWQMLAILPLSFFPAILVNLLDARTAVCTAILQAALLPLQIRLQTGDNPYQLFIFALIVSMGAIPCFRDISLRIRYLTHGLMQGALIAVAGLLAYYFAPRSGSEPTDWAHLARWTLLSGVSQGFLTGLACMLFLPMLELLFRLPTPMTLAELTDVNTPLLQRLRAEAPGTYQHSLDVAEMATNAASLIGADAKLVHVMALYHDVGKLFAPQYFAENMTGGNNPLENSLSPEESASLIFEHTFHGVQLAAKYHLSPLIFPAIRQHHGNTLLEHFYKKACDLAAERHEPPPSEERFRYPQKPYNSREVAILSLADSSEAAVRALLSTKPDLSKVAKELLEQPAEGHDANETTARYLEILSQHFGGKDPAVLVKAIDDRIASVFRKNYNDHQLDNVDLTTRELAVMAKSFRETILFHFHARPEYRTR